MSLSIKNINKMINCKNHPAQVSVLCVCVTFIGRGYFYKVFHGLSEYLISNDNVIDTWQCSIFYVIYMHVNLLKIGDVTQG